MVLTNSQISSTFDLVQRLAERRSQVEATSVDTGMEKIIDRNIRRFPNQNISVGQASCLHTAFNAGKMPAPQRDFN